MPSIPMRRLVMAKFNDHDDDDDEDLEDQIESLMKKIAQFLHTLNKLLAFLLGEELVKLYAIVGVGLGLAAFIRYCLSFRGKMLSKKSSEQSGCSGNPSETSSPAVERQSPNWSKYRLNFGIES
ncbi:hypothetical protein KSP40_PGU017076 [Platanthera guangdongensis]|uniref:ATP synthase protein MI25 n=1 Tax=Platanthera guangdongensis TaxID=2320717 RepID=A0ABR2MZL8_9ASPA